MHNWECVSCFIWEDIGESEKSSEFWNKVPLVQGPRFLCKKNIKPDQQMFFSVCLFFVLFQMSHKRLKKAQMYLLNIQFYPLICAV